MKRAFTLIELIVAFGVSVMLIGTIYFYFFGVIHTHARAQEKELLNEAANHALERMVRELRMTESLESIRPDEIVFKKYHTGSAEEEEAREFTGEKPVLDTITYKLKKTEKSHRLERRLNMEQETTVFSVEACGPDIFTGFVLEERDPDKGDTPRYHLFDPTQQASGELARVVMINLRLKLSQANDTLDIRTRVSLPAPYARLMQPAWNAD